MCVAGAFPALRYVRSIFLLWLALSALCVAPLGSGSEQSRYVGRFRMAYIIRRYPLYPCAVKAKILSSSDKLFLRETAAFVVDVELPSDLQ
jgi:hypothetical protein